MTAKEVLKELESLQSEQYKKVMLSHGVKEPIYGVKIEYLKKIQKRVKMDYRLALDLYESGIYDARYLAGLIADDAKMTRKDLQRWVEQADSPATGEYTVAWVAAGSPHGRELGLKWIDSRKEVIALAGWATLSSLVAIKEDADLDLAELKRLLDRVGASIHEQPNRVRGAMNGFVIAVGCYVKALTDHALKTAAKMGPVTVDHGKTACKTPDATEYIKKVEKRGSLGKKRKSAKC